MVAEYSDFFVGIGGGGKHVGDQVSFGIVIFAAALGGAGGVEIAQANGFQAVGSVVGFEKPFQSELRPAIGIFRPLRAILADRRLSQVRHTRSLRGKDKAADAGIYQSADERNSLLDIVFEILGGFFYGFADADE